MAKFQPQWATTRNLMNVREGDTIALQLSARMSATVMIAPGQTEIALAATEIAAIKGVEIGGTTVAYTIVGNNVRLNSARTSRSAVDIILNTPVSYRLLRGQLPPGIDLLGDGTLNGRISNIPADVDTSYEFVVRATIGTRVADREFVMLASPVQDALSWNVTTLPSPIDDPAIAPRIYFPLGTIARGGSFEINLDVNNPDETPFEMRVVAATDFVAAVGRYNGSIPAGLSLLTDPLRITGMVDPSVQPGQYFFDLRIIDPLAPSPLLVCIEISDADIPRFDPLSGIEWVTDAGLLGVIPSLEPCYVAVEAKDRRGRAVTYSIAPRSEPLPSGVSVDAETGQLRGVMPHVIIDYDYGFTIRASNGDTFVDRKFSLRTKARFSMPNITDMEFRLSGEDRTTAQRQYAAIIPPAWLFRPSDTSFGVVRNPALSIVRGLPDNADLSMLDYRDDVRIILGPHRIAVVRDNSGKVVYEVLYREVVDPIANAGGFLDTTTGIEQQTIAYPQQPSVQLRPTSLRNIRYDVIKDVGFAITDASRKNKPGINGGEALPLWMTSTQESAPLGYIPAIVFAYLLPGMGKDAIALLEPRPEIPRDGHVITFDRVLITTFQTSSTLFDAGDLIPSVLPFTVAAGATKVATRRWTSNISHVIDAATGKLITWTADRVAGTVTIPTATAARNILVYVTGTAGSGSFTENKLTGKVINTGVVTSGATMVSLNGTAHAISDFDNLGTSLRFNDDTLDNTEVLVRLKETVFDGGIYTAAPVIFDDINANKGKYVKLADSFSKKP